MVRMFNFYENISDLNNPLTLVDKIIQVFTNLQTTCSLETSTKDLYYFCERNVSQCTPSSFLENMTTNMFLLIGKFTEVSEILNDYPSNNSDILYSQTHTIGSDIGTSLRILSGFMPR